MIYKTHTQIPYIVLRAIRVRVQNNQLDPRKENFTKQYNNQFTNRLCPSKSFNNLNTKCLWLFISHLFNQLHHLITLNQKQFELPIKFQLLLQLAVNINRSLNKFIQTLIKIKALKLWNKTKKQSLKENCKPKFLPFIQIMKILKKAYSNLLEAKNISSTWKEVWVRVFATLLIVSQGKTYLRKIILNTQKNFHMMF